MSEAPTLVLVYGARRQHVATVDQRAGRYRRPHGAAAVQRAVPIPQLGDMYDDARTIRAAAQAIDGPVVVCAVVRRCAHLAFLDSMCGKWWEAVG
jgi:hypothetical protein